MDTVGPLPTGRLGHKYWLTIVDDATGFTAVTPMIARSEALSAIKRFLKRWETFEKRCRRIRLDKAGEFTSNETLAFFQDKGIAAEFTATDQHQSNGMAEVTNRILEERLHAVLIDSGLDVKYWPDLIGSVAYLRTLTPHIRLNMTPYQAWFGTIPDVSHLRPLGSRCLSYKTGPRNKIGENKGRPCKLLGYDGASVYKIVTDDGTITTTHDLTCLEDRPCAANFWAGPWKRLRPPQRGETGNDPFFEPLEAASNTITLPSQLAEDTTPPVTSTGEANAPPSTSTTALQDPPAGGDTEQTDHATETSQQPPSDSGESTSPHTPPESDQSEPDHTAPDYILPAQVLQSHPNLRLLDKAITRSGLQYGLTAIEETEPQNYNEARQSTHWKAWSTAINDEVAS
ncbi:hypothetical protein P3342_001720 [Pyrenophora teres f. teres]|nr:hypothetical protein P3342_001720 [Pyrenophora teres f. teres]